MSAKACSGCGAPVEWRLNVAGRPEPFNSDGTSHFGNCPKAHLFRRPLPGETREEGEAYRSPWGELSAADILAYQLEEGRRQVRESGVMACRDRPRDARHGDKWCRSCFQARPRGFTCPAANFRPPVRYAEIDGQLVSLTGETLAKYLRSQRQRGVSREQAFV